MSLELAYIIGAILLYIALKIMDINDWPCPHTDTSFKAEFWLCVVWPALILIGLVIGVILAGIQIRNFFMMHIILKHHIRKLLHEKPQYQSQSEEE